MISADVVVAGSGPAAKALCMKFVFAGFDVALVTTEPVPAEETFVLHGRLVVTGNHEVTILNPETGDERRVLKCGALLFTSLPAGEQGIGLAKFGVDRDSTGRLAVSSSGKTQVGWIFAVGEAASSSMPVDDNLLLDAVRTTLAAQSTIS